MVITAKQEQSVLFFNIGRSQIVTGQGEGHEPTATSVCRFGIKSVIRLGARHDEQRRELYFTKSFPVVKRKNITSDKLQ